MSGCARALASGSEGVAPCRRASISKTLRKNAGLSRWMRNWRAAISHAAEFRLRVDVELDELADRVVPSALSPVESCLAAFPTRRSWGLTESDDEIGALL